MIKYRYDLKINKGKTDINKLQIDFNNTRGTIAKGLCPIFSQMLDLLKDKYKSKQLTKYDTCHITFKYGFFKVNNNRAHALILVIYARDPLSTINFQVAHLYDLDNRKLYYSLEPQAEKDLLNNRDTDFVSLFESEFDKILQTAEKRTISYIKNRIDQNQNHPDLKYINNGVLNYQMQIRELLKQYATDLCNQNKNNYPREVVYLLNQSNSPLTLVSQYTTTEGLTHYELSCTGICVKVTYYNNMQFDNLKIEDYIPHNAKSKMQAKLNVPIVLDLCKSLYSLS